MLIAYADAGRDHVGMPALLRDVLTARRESLGLKQPEVAAALGVTVDQLSRWERGYTAKIPGEIAVRLMGMYRLSVEQVLAEIGSPEAVDPRQAVEEKVDAALSNRGLGEVGRVARESSEAPAPPRRSRGGRGRQA